MTGVIQDNALSLTLKQKRRWFQQDGGPKECLSKTSCSTLRVTSGVLTRLPLVSDVTGSLPGVLLDHLHPLHTLIWEGKTIDSGMLQVSLGVPSIIILYGFNQQGLIDM